MQFPKTLWAVVMAGGSGSRFWPRSTPDTPKQFLPIGGGSASGTQASLIAQTVERLLQWMPADRILVVGLLAHEKLLMRHLPQLPAANFVLEPFGRNTAASVALGTRAVQQRAGGSSFSLVLPADHHIAQPEQLYQAVAAGLASFGERESLMTFGIEPRRPEVGYGYIEAGESIGVFDGLKVCIAAKFKEKPEHKVAEGYLQEFRRSGRYLWNSGMFLWPTALITKELETFAADTWERLKGVTVSTDGPVRVAAGLFDPIERTSIDYAVMERSKRVAVIRTPMLWSDLGGWQAVYELSDKDATANAVAAKAIAIQDSSGNLVHAPEHEVVLMGADDLVVAVHGDRVLVCKRERASDIRASVERLKD